MADAKTRWDNSEMPWFQSKGQICQTALALVGVLIAGKNAWPDMKANAYFTGGAILFYVLVALVVGSILHLIAVSRKRVAPPSTEGNAVASYHEARAGEFKEQVDRLTKERDHLLSEQARINQHRVDLLGTLAQAKEASSHVDNRAVMERDQIIAERDKTIEQLQKDLTETRQRLTKHRANTLTIHKAEWIPIQHGDSRRVERFIQERITEAVVDSVSFKLNNPNLGGELPGAKETDKILKLSYSYGDKPPRDIAIKEYEWLILPEPPVDEPRKAKLTRGGLSPLENRVYTELDTEFQNMSWTQKVAMKLLCDGIKHEQGLAEHMRLMGIGPKDFIMIEIVNKIRNSGLVESKPDGTLKPSAARLRDVEEIVTNWDLAITPRV
jgi:hypothetical protein